MFPYKCVICMEKNIMGMEWWRIQCLGTIQYINVDNYTGNIGMCSICYYLVIMNLYWNMDPIMVVALTLLLYTRVPVMFPYELMCGTVI